jgi:hypothetical protein
MSDAQNVELKPEDRMAQAGIVLVEQVGMSLFSDAYSFPKTTQGHMQTVDRDGTLKIDGPVDELVKTSMMFKKDESTTQFGTWNHLEATDGSGKSLAKVDQVNMGFLLDVLLSGKMGSHTDFRGSDGRVQFSLDGLTVLTPHDSSAGTMSGKTLPDPGKPYTNDTTSTIKDADGNYVGDVHVTARPTGKGNVLDINATYNYKDTYVGDIEAIITVDPANHNKASFEIKKAYNPPPPKPALEAPAK